MVMRPDWQTYKGGSRPALGRRAAERQLAASTKRALGRTKQRIIANLGRREVVVARGDLDRLARSVARMAQRSMVLSLVEGEAPPNAVCRRIGPALLFERLWQEVGCRAVLECESAPNRDPAEFCPIPLTIRAKLPHGWGPNRRRPGPRAGRKSAKQLNILSQFMGRVPPRC
jgi:hypothetical protein